MAIPAHLLSPAQCAGYGVFVLGVAAFTQKSDRRLKLFSATQCLVYGAHFALLGNLPASATSMIACVRTALALKYGSMLLAAAIIALNIASGFLLAGRGPGWLPVIASCAATVAIFRMRGVRMRLVLLVCTVMWLINNIISGSIGGMMLEVFIAVANGWTIAGMLRSVGHVANPPGGC